MTSSQTREDILKKVLPSDIKLEEFTEKEPESIYTVRFRNIMQSMKITVINQYKNSKTKVDLLCDVCGHKWAIYPQHAYKNGCPNCARLARNVTKEEKMWAWTMKIINDKSGSIVSVKKYPEGHNPSMKDSFKVKCLYKHTWLTNHSKIKADQWCPACKRIAGIPDFESKYSTSRKLTSEEIDYVLTQIALRKGIRITSKIEEDLWAGECIKCTLETKVTKAEIRKKTYLCSNKCIKGGHVPIKQYFVESGYDINISDDTGACMDADMGAA
jgi:hypothetical protein